MSIKGFFSNWIVRNILLAIAIVLVLAFSAHLLLKVFTKHNQEIPVPDFINMSVDEASRAAKKAGMTIDVVDSVYVRRMAKGAIYSQNPPAGNMVKEGRRISLTINAVNSKKVTMPNLVGYSLRQAKAELQSRGLQIGRLIYTPDIATNNVIAQLYRNMDIVPGKKIESESPIDLVLGLNEQDNVTYIPLLTGMKFNAAKDAIHNSSLNVRKIVFDRSVKDYTDSLNAVVYRQEPDTTNVPAIMGTEVSIYLTADKNRVPKNDSKK